MMKHHRNHNFFKKAEFVQKKQRCFSTIDFFCCFRENEQKLSGHFWEFLFIFKTFCFLTECSAFFEK